MASKIDARAADRGCAKEAQELLEEIDLRRYHGDTKDVLLQARLVVGNLVALLVQEGQS